MRPAWRAALRWLDLSRAQWEGVLFLTGYFGCVGGAAGGGPWWFLSFFPLYALSRMAWSQRAQEALEQRTR